MSEDSKNTNEIKNEEKTEEIKTEENAPTENEELKKEENSEEKVDDEKVEEKKPEPVKEEEVVIDPLIAKEAKRQKDLLHATREALTTEVTYVDQLLLLEREFMKPIKDSMATRTPILEMMDYQLIFMDIEIIINVNKELLKSLKDWFRFKKLLNDNEPLDENVKPEDRTLGKIFLKMTPFLKSYKNYTSKYENNFKIISERRKGSKNFKKFLEKTEFQPHTKFQSLDSLLILPVQRIPRYNMLLGEIIKHTKKDESDYEHLVSALDLIQKVAVTVNDHVKELEIRQKIIDIGNSIANSIDIIAPSRKYVTEGTVFLISNKHGLCSRYVFLFNDLILFTSIKAQNDDFDLLHLIQGTSQHKYSFRSAVSFTNTPICWINDVEDGEIVQNAFQFVSPNKTWTLFFKTKEEKLQWMNHINKQLEFIEKNTPNLKGKEKSKIIISPKGFVTKYLLINTKKPGENVIIQSKKVEELKDDTQPKKENKRISGFFGKLFAPKEKENKKKVTEEGKPVLICSDSENEEDEEDVKSKGKDERNEEEKEFFTQFLSRFVEYYTFTNLRQVLSSSEKPLKETFLKEWQEGIEEMDAVIINPLFGSRPFSRAIHQTEKVTTSKEEDYAYNLYRYQVLIPIKMRNLEWEQTLLVDELIPIPMNEKDVKEKKKWDKIILSDKELANSK